MDQISRHEFGKRASQVHQYREVRAAAAASIEAQRRNRQYFLAALAGSVLLVIWFIVTMFF